MELLDQVLIPRELPDSPPAAIQLLRGNLAEIPAEHAVDLLVVSAFPNSYTPNQGTLFESLHRRGLDMAEVARFKAEDQRAYLGCWLSRPLPAHLAERFHFRQILCFEPRFPRFLETVDSQELEISGQVGLVFRCLNNFVIPDSDGRERGRDRPISRVAMPLLAAGNQGEPVERILPMILDAACFWLTRGLPVSELKIVAFREADVAAARSIFEEFRRGRKTKFSHRPSIVERSGDSSGKLAARLVETCRHELGRELLALAELEERPVIERVLSRAALNSAPRDSSEKEPSYDLFVSYAHKQDTEVAAFVSALQAASPGLRIFHDRSAILVGDPWLKRISDAIQGARSFVAILSPDYSASPVCWDEFQCAKLKEYTTRIPVIQTIRLYRDPQLPPIMGVHSYEDCSEGDIEKLKRAAAKVVPH